MAEIAFENGRISNCKGLATMTLSLDRVILHTIVHRSSTSTYTPNLIKIKETFCGRTDVRIRTHGRADGHLRPALLHRLCRRVDLKTNKMPRVNERLSLHTDSRCTWYRLVSVLWNVFENYSNNNNNIINKTSSWKSKQTSL